MEDRLKRYLSLISIHKPADTFSYPKDLLEPIEVPPEPDMSLERQIVMRYASEEERKADLRVLPKPVALSNTSGGMRA